MLQGGDAAAPALLREEVMLSLQELRLRVTESLPAGQSLERGALGSLAGGTGVAMGAPGLAEDGVEAVGGDALVQS